MKIAVICWGSLYWDKGCLKTSAAWKNDGPELQLEFCRISSHGQSKERVTLVLSESGQMCVSYWDLMAASDLKSAIKNLKDREGCPMGDIHSFRRNQNPLSDIDKQIELWLADHQEVEAVIWTGLTSNWPRYRNAAFTIEDFVLYLNSKKHSIATIKQYFEKVPAQSQTVASEVFTKWCVDQGV